MVTSTELKTIKYKLADQMRNSMHIMDNYLPLLQCYKMIAISGCEFRSCLYDGTLQYRGRDFDVIYHQCFPHSAKNAKEVRISFRAALAEFNLPAIALVQIVEA